MFHFSYLNNLGTLEVLGLAILLGFLFSNILRHFKVPAVASYVLIGILLGSSVFNIFFQNLLSHMGLISDIALGIIAFIIGGELRLSSLLKMGRLISFIVLLEAFGAFFFVLIGINFLTHNPSLAFILAAISAATAPAATVMVIKEMKADGPFTRTLLATVAIDDGIALLIYSIAATIAKSLISASESLAIIPICTQVFTEIIGSLFLGLVMGYFSVFITRRYRDSETIFVFILGTLMLISGMAKHLHISALLTNMTFGLILTNYVPIASNKVFKQIQKAAPPIFIAFFVTAGAHLRLDVLPQIWKIALIYFTCRVLGKIIGASTGSILGKAEQKIQKYIGFGLLSQVGVALGLGLIVSHEFAELGPEGQKIGLLVINVLLATTIFTEIIGPLLTSFALIKTNEAYAIKRRRGF